ncbi:MAG TPA: CotH kinase family protein [Chitinispirillaceae bacterium]|nr:CotH kinase family protein [Chitinispirillaceae bacterium]
MNKLVRYYLSAGIAAVLMIPVQAEEVNLQGKVIDTNGDPVNGAQVKLSKLKFSCTTDNSGNFQLKNTGVSYGLNQNTRGIIRLKNKVLELGNYSSASVTVFSINGATLNKINIEKQNRISIEKLIPATINSQTVILSITAGKEKVNLKAVKCGSQWLWNDVQNGSIYHNFKSASAAADDTLKVSKSGKQTYTLPISSLVANLAVIILYDDNKTDDSASMIGDVAFSEPSKTFKNSLSVKLSTEIPDAQIRYTIDGQLPTSSSTLYNDQAVNIKQTTQLRAAAFVNGTLSGKYSTAIYIAINFDYTSDIPIIILEGYGKGKPKDKYNFIDVAFMAFEPVNGVADINNLPTLVTRAGYHLRGQSSLMMFAQAPYRIEFWDNNNKDADYPALGMPKSSDWALISICTDNSLIRNVLGFEIGKAAGLAAVQYRWAEVFINQDSGAVQKSDYEGIYNLIQPIKNRKTTLDLKKLKSDDTDPAKISGGYIFKFDQMVDDNDMIKLQCTGAKKITEAGGGWGGKVDSNATCWDDLELVDPAEPNDQQIAWITDYIQQFHNALHAKPAGDWKKYVDMNSFVNIHVLNEITRNVDAWVKSHYMYKDRDLPIVAGPVWDYNFALGNYTDGNFGMSSGTKKTGWHILDNRTGSGDWHTMMWKQPEFKSAFKNRYQELRKSALTDAAIDKIIDDITKPLNNVAQRNFSAYPMGDCFTEEGKRQFGSMFKQVIKDSTWNGQVDSVRIWTKKRLKTLDSLSSTLN